MYNYNIFNNKDKLNEIIETESHLINKKEKDNLNYKLIILIIYLYSLSCKYP